MTATVASPTRAPRVSKRSVASITLGLTALIGGTIASFFAPWVIQPILNKEVAVEYTVPASLAVWGTLATMAGVTALLGVLAVYFGHSGLKQIDGAQGRIWGYGMCVLGIMVGLLGIMVGLIIAYANLGYHADAFKDVIFRKY